MTCAGNSVNPSSALNAYKDLALRANISIEPPTVKELSELNQNTYYKKLTKEAENIKIVHIYYFVIS